MLRALAGSIAATAPTESRSAQYDYSCVVPEGRNTLLITHRLAGLDAVDEVIVLARGQVVQRGAFAELVAVAGPLREMAERERLSTAARFQEVQRLRPTC